MKRRDTTKGMHRKEETKNEENNNLLFIYSFILTFFKLVAPSNTVLNYWHWNEREDRYIALGHFSCA